MIRFECKKCGCLVLANKGSKTATCDICGKKQPVPVDVIDLGTPVTSHSYDPQWQHYEQLLRKARRYRDIQILTETAEEFDRLGEYEDSRAMADFCRAKAAEEEKKREAEAEMRKVQDHYKKRAKIINGTQMALITAAIIAAVILISYFSNRAVKLPKYEQAQALMSQGEYDEAQNILRKLGYYKDSVALFEECEAAILEERYNVAIYHLEKGNYRFARIEFEKLEDYEDSETYVLECKYRQACQYMDEGYYNAALADLSTILDYKDAAALTDKINEILSNP